MNPITSLLRRRTKVAGHRPLGSGTSRRQRIAERFSAYSGRASRSHRPHRGGRVCGGQRHAQAHTDVINLFDTVAGTKEAIFTNDLVSFKAVQNPNLSTLLSALSVSDLQSIVENSAEWGMTSDIANLAGKVVGYNLANEHYRGKDLLKSGQLAAGDQAVALYDLVEKSFEGADLPAIGVGGATYQTAHGTLFGPNGPLASDVAQGTVGDCYFLSNLAETAQQAPKDIENMFIDHGHGIYTVRFYQYNSSTKTNTADYVTVNSKLPAYSDGQFVYANTDFGGHSTNIDNPDNVLWVALAEKAYARAGREGLEPRRLGRQCQRL